MVEYIRSAIVALVSCLITLFSPIEDIMLGMVVLLAVNGLFGLLADIFNGVGWKTKGNRIPLSDSRFFCLGNEFVCCWKIHTQARGSHNVC